MSLNSKSMMPETLNVSLGARGPSTKSCMSQINSDHAVQVSEMNYANDQNNIAMLMLRNREGIHAPLKISMELQAAKKIGRLPFLQSSNVQLDVLLGRDEIMQFSDFLGVEENFEYNRQPHIVVEKTLGIL